MASQESYFREADVGGLKLWDLMEAQPQRGTPTLDRVLKVLDYLHADVGLLRAYHSEYPLVEPRELVPSFDSPFIEYQELPAFSFLVLDREVSYQDEGFQFDILLPEGSPPDPGVAAANRQVLRQRLPRDQLPQLEQDLGRKAPTLFSRYALVLPHLTKMDRGHVLARGEDSHYMLAGIFASFPSDLDGEIKRFGKQIGKFSDGDNQRYAQNRLFVYRFLMEQLGFPICGERHTSAALFARRLMRRRERFAVKVLGHSDRTITTLTSLGSRKGLPRVEKLALVQARGCTPEGMEKLSSGGFYVDPERRVVLLRVRYRQHSYHPDNVLEARALSVAGQEVVHPQTGEALEMDILGLGQDRLLMLNDIVRGEHEGSIVYREAERIQGTRDLRSRLKFLIAWLDKHHSLLADYSPDTFERVARVVFSLMEDPDLAEEMEKEKELKAELSRTIGGLRLAHRLRLLEKLVQTRSDSNGAKLQHMHILVILVHVLSHEGDQLAAQHSEHLAKLISICRRELDNAYLKRRYLSKKPSTASEREVVGHYRLLENLTQRYSNLGRD